MIRTIAACAATAALTAAATTGLGIGSGYAKPRLMRIAVGDTAVFAGQDLLCVNEPVSRTPRFKKAGVACSSTARPYQGVGVWLTQTALVVTRPPNGKVVSAFAR